MSNVLSEEKKQQVIALGKLGWPLRRIEQATGVRRETAGAYLKAAGIAVRPPGSVGTASAGKTGQRGDHRPWSRDSTLDVLFTAKPANEVTTDFGQRISPPVATRIDPPVPASRTANAIEQGLGRGRNAMAIWQDLVSDYSFPGGYETVKRFVHKLRGSERPEAVGIILTAAGEEAQVDYGPVRWFAIRRAASIDGHDCSS